MWEAWEATHPPTHPLRESVCVCVCAHYVVVLEGAHVAHVSRNVPRTPTHRLPKQGGQKKIHVVEIPTTKMFLEGKLPIDPKTLEGDHRSPSSVSTCCEIFRDFYPKYIRKAVESHEKQSNPEMSEIFRHAHSNPRPEKCPKPQVPSRPFSAPPRDYSRP